LVSQLREDLLLCSSYLPLEVPNGLLHAIKQFFWRRCRGSKKKKLPHQPRTSNFSGAVAGEKEDFCKGSLSRSTVYFVFVLLYFILACIILSKNTKKLVPLIVCIPLLLSLVHYVVP
jgi:hypothetical protein